MYCEWSESKTALTALRSSNLSSEPSPSRSMRRYANCMRRSNVSTWNLDRPYTNSRKPISPELSRSNIFTRRSQKMSGFKPKMRVNPTLSSCPAKSGAPSRNMACNRASASWNRRSLTASFFPPALLAIGDPGAKPLASLASVKNRNESRRLSAAAKASLFWYFPSAFSS